MNEHIAIVPIQWENEAGDASFREDYCHRILWIRSGTGTVRLNGVDYPLTENTLCLICPEDCCHICATPRLSGLELRFHFSFFSHSFFLPLLAPFADENRVRHACEEDINRFLEIYTETQRERSPLWEQQALARLTLFLSALDADSEETENRSLHTPRSKITVDVIKYINEHVTEAMTLDDIAGEMFVSKYHMCHVFKQEMNMSIGEMVLIKKVNYADHLLSMGIPAQRVSEMVGFNYYSAFFRIYKRIKGHSPQSRRGNKN